MSSVSDLRDATALAKQAVLDKIASGESPDYNTIYGGQKFSDLTVHPNVRVPILDKAGKPTGQVSTAAGRYQFLKGTWDSQAEKLGLTDFSPASQDVAAWDLAESVYKQRTSRDLLADAKNHLVNWGALGDTWTSLRGKGEEGGGTGTAPSSDASYDVDLPDHVLELGKSPKPSGFNSLLWPLIQQQLSKHYDLTPVEYDPWALQKAGESG